MPHIPGIPGQTKRAGCKPALFQKEISGSVTQRLGSRIGEFQGVGATQLLLDVGHDTHFRSFVGLEAIDLRQLKDRTKEFILNPLDDENLPEKANKDIELPDGGKWVYPVSEGVVSLQTTRDTGYQSYIMVQNELTRAFNEVRDEVAQRKFGAKFADLPEELRNAVSKAVPLKISEAEPRNIKK